MKRVRKKLAKKHQNTLRPVILAGMGLVLLTYLLPLCVILPRAEGAERSLSHDEADMGNASSAEPDLSLIIEENPPEPAENVPKEEKEPSKTDKSPSPTDMTLRCLLEGEVRELELEDYLWGVVAAEMPASFDQDALCAQAVAARTYTLYRMANPTPNHPEADICGDPGCCQAWMSHEERLNDWSKSEQKALEKKVNKAISKTKGRYLAYNDEPIMAAFHAASAGSTKSALEVWGEDVPYLQEVKSPEDEATVPNYYSTVEVADSEFIRIIEESCPEAVFGEDRESWLGAMEYDKAGLPISVVIGGVKLSTGRVRSLFGLRSASFSAEYGENGVVFYVTGYGHGVGMSQYGANALAKEGKNWKEIVGWYYPNTKLAKVG